jgi:hypothetical protein
MVGIRKDNIEVPPHVGRGGGREGGQEMLTFQKYGQLGKQNMDLKPELIPAG